MAYKTAEGSRPPLEEPDMQRFKQLTERDLPALANQQRWPIRFDHCFKRICLDYAFEDVWYNHLPRPAERHLTGPPLQRAIQCAEDLLTQGKDLLLIHNTASLRYRGKSGHREKPGNLDV